MQKSNFYEGSVHVPLAIHVPWLSRGRVEFDGPISSTDIMPTLLDLMGIDVAGQVDGRSRAGVLRDPANWRRESITVEWNDPEVAACSGRSRVTATRNDAVRRRPASPTSRRRRRASLRAL